MKRLIFLFAIVLLMPLVCLAQQWALVKVSVASMRTEGRHSAELSTQALMGTPLKILKQQGEWYYVQMPDGYKAYVPESLIEYQRAAGHVIRNCVLAGQCVPCPDRDILVSCEPSARRDWFTNGGRLIPQWSPLLFCRRGIIVAYAEHDSGIVHLHEPVICRGDIQSCYHFRIRSLLCRILGHLDSSGNNHPRSSLVPGTQSLRHESGRCVAL